MKIEMVSKSVEGKATLVLIIHAAWNATRIAQKQEDHKDKTTFANMCNRI